MRRQLPNAYSSVRRFRSYCCVHGQQRTPHGQCNTLCVEFAHLHVAACCLPMYSHNPITHRVHVHPYGWVQVDLAALAVQSSLHGLYARPCASMQSCLATHPKTGLLMVPRAESLQLFDLHR
jgi:hypothetical protein